MATLIEQIMTLAAQLSPEMQLVALERIKKLAGVEETSQSDLPTGTPASALLDAHFSMSKEEADTMAQAIMEDGERSIDDDETCNHGQF